MTTELDAVYRERNAVVAALVRATGWRCWVADDPADPEFHIVYVETPAGQASWHVSASDIVLFADEWGAPLFSSRGSSVWDGHTTEEKYQRLARLRPVAAGVE